MQTLADLYGFNKPQARARALLRDPYESEAAFFRGNPNVAGMATEDNRIILNPHTGLKPQERDAVMMNEFYRVMQRNPMMAPSEFAITPEQAQRFAGYGAPQDIRATILSRILTNDPSVGAIPAHQQMAADWLRTQVNQQ